MFSSRSHLQKRTPEGGIDREQYIGLLGEEYYTTSSAGKLLRVKNTKCFLLKVKSFNH